MNSQLHTDERNVHIEHYKALLRVMAALIKDETELFKQFMDKERLKRRMTDTVLGLCYNFSSDVLRD